MRDLPNGYKHFSQFSRSIRFFFYFDRYPKLTNKIVGFNPKQKNISFILSGIMLDVLKWHSNTSHMRPIDQKYSTNSTKTIIFCEVVLCHFATPFVSFIKIDFP